MEQGSAAHIREKRREKKMRISVFRKSIEARAGHVSGDKGSNPFQDSIKLFNYIKSQILKKQSSLACMRENFQTSPKAICLWSVITGDSIDYIDTSIETQYENV